MENKESNFSNFGITFQEKLVRILLKEKVFCSRIREILNINFFEHKYLQVITKEIFSYKDKYGKLPTISSLETILNNLNYQQNTSLKQQILDFYYNSIKTNEKIEDIDFIKDRSIDFCKKQTLKEAMMKSIDCLEKSSFDDISVLINNALKLGVDENYGYDYVEDFDKRFRMVYRNPVSTGWPLIDEIIQGGLGKGELGVVLAPSGCGKSMILVHLGAMALKQGKSVVHYTLELSDTHVAMRYDSCLTGIKLKDLRELKEKVFEGIKDIPGKLIIKEYPTKSASVLTIRNHLDRLKQNDKKVDLVLVDYADLLKSMSNYKDKRFEIESIYEDLRFLAQDYELSLLSASQTNRSGMNAELVTMQSISEAINKVFVADLIISLSRTIEDKKIGTGRLYVAKSRLGPDGIVFPIRMDTSRVQIEVLQKEQMKEISSKEKETEDKKKLTQKFKKYVEEKKEQEKNG